MKRLIVLGFLLLPFFAAPVFAQFTQDSVMDLGPGKTKRMAKKLFKKGSYYNSLEYWEAYNEKKPEKLSALEEIAEVNFLLRDYKMAEKWYGTLLESDTARKFPKTRYYYALMQKYNGKY